MFSTIRRWFKRKRKSDKSIDHPDYFVSESEFELIEISEAFIQASIQANKSLPTAAEATELLIRIFAAWPSAEELLEGTWANSQHQSPNDPDNPFHNLDQGG